MLKINKNDISTLKETNFGERIEDLGFVESVDSLTIKWTKVNSECVENCDCYSCIECGMCFKDEWAENETAGNHGDYDSTCEYGCNWTFNSGYNPDENTIEEYVMNTQEEYDAFIKKPETIIR